MKRLTREQELALAKRFDELAMARMPRHVYSKGVPPLDDSRERYVHKPYCISKTMPGSLLCNCQCEA